MDTALDTLLTGFCAEAQGYVKSLRALLRPAAGPASAAEPLTEVYNLFQILAGSAHALGLEQVAAPAGSAVRLLESLAGAGSELNSSQRQQLHQWLDDVDRALAGLAVGAELQLIPQQPGNGKRPRALPDDLVAIFAQEAQEHSETIQAGLAQLQGDPGHKEALREVRRATHTLKGAAASVGIEPVADLAHAMEDLLEVYIGSGAPLVPEAVTLLLDSADALGSLLEPEGAAESFAPLQPLLDRFSRLPRPDTPPGLVPEAETSAQDVGGVTGGLPQRRETDSTLRVPLKKVDLLINQVGEVVIGHSTVEGYLEDFRNLLLELDYSSRRLQRLARDIESQIEASALGNSEIIDVAGSHFDPLELDRYTTLYQLTRGLEEVAADTGNVNRELQELAQGFDASLTRERRLTSDIQDQLMAARLVPFQHIETRLRRTVRQTARDLGKSAEFILSGLDVLVDKTVLDALTEALLHLLRNAVDHGLESPADRQAAGKPAAGTISLSIAREQGRTVLRLSDDGAGIDFDKVRQHALSLGLVNEEQARDRDRLVELLFEEDFSLAKKVTHTSGRGIGLSIVRRTIKQLQGTLQLESTLGRGTAFILSVPVTLAIARALYVRTCGATYAIPLQQIAAVLRLSPEMMAQLESQGVLRYEGRSCAIYDLADFVGAKPDPGAQRYGLLVEYGERSAIVLIDSLVGMQATVIKSLGTHLRRVHGLSGATIIGNGTVVLILDLAEIVGGAAVSVRHQGPAHSVPAADQPARQVLVVDDSLSVRRAVCLTLEQAGWQTTTAKDGIEALERLVTVRPAVALVDIEMPRMNGFELLARIRADASLKSLAVIFLTSRSSAKHREHARSLGCDGYIVKPYSEDELLAELERVSRVGQP